MRSYTPSRDMLLAEIARSLHATRPADADALVAELERRVPDDVLRSALLRAEADSIVNAVCGFLRIRPGMPAERVRQTCFVGAAPFARAPDDELMAAVSASLHETHRERAWQVIGALVVLPSNWREEFRQAERDSLESATGCGWIAVRTDMQVIRIDPSLVHASGDRDECRRCLQRRKPVPSVMEPHGNANTDAARV